MTWKFIAKWLFLTTMASLAPPIFEWALTSHVGWQRFGIQFGYSFIYANCIGIPLLLTCQPVWIATCNQPAWLRWILRGALVVGADFVGSLLAGWIVWEIEGKSYSFGASFKGSLVLSVVISIVIVAFVSAYETQKNKLQVTAMALKTKELERERAIKLATEARLSSLESRVHPHFLFNTINSVSSLIHDDPHRAEKMLSQMAELLRFSLDSAQSGLVGLEREMKIVEDYLQIEKARFNDRLQYQIAVPPALYSASVPPLCVQTLVENSVKYAVSPRRRGALIRISAAAQNGRLHLEVSDNGPGFEAVSLPAGHGMNNLQDRLAAIFGERGKLDIATSEDGTRVIIEMPLLIGERAAVSPEEIDAHSAAVKL
ncbi:MAG: histidine kinase [Acidobacteriaceae bacterium]|nr:histidine kinase [Acidobacteriaceae bacterium]MBV9502272.1 histidine kinase [Acidobacteriaceae bacterium]